MKTRQKKKYLMAILAIVFVVAGIAVAIYVGAWMMFIKSIMVACAAFDAGSLTASLIGTTVLKCIFAGPVCALFVSAGCVVANIFLAV